MRPLDSLGSIKLKLGVVIVAAVVVTVLVAWVGDRLGLSPVIAGLAAVAIALALVQLLAHGMTFPLREMVSAAQAMAVHGRLSSTVSARPRAGYLASVSDVLCKARRLDDLGGELVIEAERLAGDEARVLYAFRVLSKNHEVLSGKAAVVLAA